MPVKEDMCLLIRYYKLKNIYIVLPLQILRANRKQP